MKNYKQILHVSIAILCMLAIPTYTKADEILINNLYDINGNELKTNKDYNLHIIYKNRTNFYPIYNTAIDGWQYGYSSWYEFQPPRKSIVKLQVSGKEGGASIEPNDRILIEVPYDTEEKSYRYWTIYSSWRDSDLYLDTLEKSSQFKLTRFKNEFYHDNRYSLGQITTDNTYRSFGRVGDESHTRDSQILEITSNNYTQVEFKPV